MSDLVPWLAILPFLAVPVLVYLHGKLDDRIGHERRLAYQADRQHRYVLAGDDLGVYGHLGTVKNMKIITAWKADDPGIDVDKCYISGCRCGKDKHE